MVQILRRYVDKVAFRRMAMLPVRRVARSVTEALKLSDRLGQHFGLVVFVDDPVSPFILLEKRWS